ncbi:MAG: hypothetical protein E7242_04390 [Lachnospiraceae bacterium]|nr:hypothetical protein [Lachnospiraceae bacterium]
MHLNPGTKHVIVFDSSQVKLTTNENPTSNEDIRYSRRDFQELADRMETMSDEEINKLKSEKPFQIVSNHTPKILIDKAGAQDLALIMRTDSMYLAIRHDGALEGH